MQLGFRERKEEPTAKHKEHTHMKNIQKQHCRWHHKKNGRGEWSVIILTEYVLCAGRFLFVGLYVGVVCQCHRTTHERGSKSILLFYTCNQAPVLHVLSSRKEKKLKRNKKSGTRPHISFESCGLNFADQVSAEAASWCCRLPVHGAKPCLF